MPLVRIRAVRRPEWLWELKLDRLRQRYNPLHFMRSTIGPLWFVSVLCCLVGIGRHGFAQNSPPASLPRQDGPVQDLGRVIYTVTDLDKAAAFYHNVFGFKVRSKTSSAAVDVGINRLCNTTTAKFRSAVFDIPGASFALEVREFTNIERHRAIRRYVDPGNVLLNIDVTNVDAMLARATAAGAEVVTIGGAVITRPSRAVRGTTRSIYIRDIDGFTCHLEQFQPESRRPTNPDQVVLGADVVRITVSSTDVSVFWRPFGIDVRPATTVAEEDRPANEARLSATEGYTFRFADAVIASSNRHFQIQEWVGGDRHPFIGQPSDPGTPTISFMVKDLEAASEAVRISRAQLVTRGGAVPIGDRGRSAMLVRGPDGLLIELVTAATAR